MADFEELWNKSGEAYVAYSKQYPQYDDTNDVIVEAG